KSHRTKFELTDTLSKTGNCQIESRLLHLSHRSSTSGRSRCSPECLYSRDCSEYPLSIFEANRCSFHTIAASRSLLPPSVFGSERKCVFGEQTSFAQCMPTPTDRGRLSEPTQTARSAHR